MCTQHRTSPCPAHRLLHCAINSQMQLIWTGLFAGWTGLDNSGRIFLSAGGGKVEQQLLHPIDLLFEGVITPLIKWWGRGHNLSYNHHHNGRGLDWIALIVHSNLRFFPVSNFKRFVFSPPSSYFFQRGLCLERVWRLPVSWRHVQCMCQQTSWGGSTELLAFLALPFLCRCHLAVMRQQRQTVHWLIVKSEGHCRLDRLV